MTRDQLILAWSNAKAELDKAKANEAALREQVLQSEFKFDKIKLRKGTENIELGNGYKLKGVFKLSHSLENKNGELDKVLDQMEASGTEGKLYAERVVKWKPELSVTEYEKLPEQYRKMIDVVVTTKVATPSLELVAPK